MKDGIKVELVQNDGNQYDIADYLLPFDGVDQHVIWPLGTYRIRQYSPGAVYHVMIGTVGDEDRSFVSGDYGTREYAVAACRNDLRLRLRAVRELEVMTND